MPAVGLEALSPRSADDRTGDSEVAGTEVPRQSPGAPRRNEQREALRVADQLSGGGGTLRADAGLHEPHVVHGRAPMPHCEIGQTLAGYLTQMAEHRLAFPA
jgi:hypothetical protein